MGNICNKEKSDPVNMKLKTTSVKRNTLESISGYENSINLSNFIIRGNLGKGSFGKVYLVESKEDSCYYAMKILNKVKIKENDLIENTKVERIILSTLSFPFIVNLHSSFQTNNRLFIITEYIEGGDLFHLILKLGRFNHEQIKLYAAEIILSLDYLHKNNCIYRDLKPENIFLTADLRAKLGDFG